MAQNNIANNKLAEDLKSLTPDDLKEISEEPGDINDIMQQTPQPHNLQQFQKLLEAMPREQMTEFLANLTNGNGMNPVNPNNNTYSGISKDGMLKDKLKQKIRQKQVGRMGKGAKEYQKEKFIKEAEEKLKEHQESLSKLQNSQKITELDANAQPEHVHGPGCNH